MARQAPRRNQDGVKTQLEFGILRVRRQPDLRRVDNPRLLPWRDGEGGLIQRRAGLDLDKGDQIAPLRDQVDLAMRRAESAWRECDSPWPSEARRLGFPRKGRC